MGMEQILEGQKKKKKICSFRSADSLLYINRTPFRYFSCYNKKNSMRSSVCAPGQFEVPIWEFLHCSTIMPPPQ